MPVIDDPDFLTNRSKQLSAFRSWRTLDQSVAGLRERIRRLEIDVERIRLSIEIAIAASSDRGIGLMPQRGAA
jgi:hypothetical protein